MSNSNPRIYSRKPIMSTDAPQAREAAAAPEEAATWLNQKERGALLGIRLVFFLATALGRFPAGLFLRVVVLWYTVFDATARRTSGEFLARVYGRPAKFSEVYRHMYCFARVALDRIFLLLGRTNLFQVTRNGNHHLEELAKKKQGAILLGAHLGSFEAMRAGAKTEQFPLNILGHFENARMINALLEQLDPEAAARVLHIGKDPVGLAIEVRERLETGEMVALLGDRVGLNDKHTTANFLGDEALFPTGPFLLASALKCPIYLVFGLYSEPNRYDLYCEPFVDSVKLPRKSREEALQGYVQQYADRVAHYAKLAPYNWFNFHDFWRREDK